MFSFSVSSMPTEENDIRQVEIPDECVLKVFKTTLNEFKTREKYIKHDIRFKDKISKQVSTFFLRADSLSPSRRECLKNMTGASLAHIHS